MAEDYIRIFKKDVGRFSDWSWYIRSMKENIDKQCVLYLSQKLYPIHTHANIYDYYLLEINHGEKQYRLFIRNFPL